MRTTRTMPRAACSTPSTVGDPTSALAAKEYRTDDQHDSRERKLRKHSCTEREPVAGEAERRLDLLLPHLHVVLKFAGEKLAELGVDAIDVCRPAYG